MLKLYRSTLSFTILWSVLPNTPLAAQLSAKQGKLDFEPKLGLKWPGKVTESNQTVKDEKVETRFYNATCTKEGPMGAMMFFAHVMELDETELKGTSPKKVLDAYTFASKDDETSRKAIEYGSKKYPGLDIVTRWGKSFCRKKVVMVRSRIYEVAVVGPNEESLKVPEVKAFLESLTVGD
jgi:hypothetical protein